MSTRLDVLAAIKALIGSTRPQADVRGMLEDDIKPDEVGPGGAATVESGDPGDPSIDMSPPTYWWEHSVPIELVSYPANGLTSQQILDDWLMTIGRAVEADRTLGGLCTYLDVSAPTDGIAAVAGAAPIGWAAFTITASYSTTSPLG
ncbi:hypothetical protein [Sphingomonas sp. CFBP 8760]|uniref:hypothetical protein n=1 Tax=Sphingomonas sp. CFBP 8760 TaxID=2775282 RepID=UPI0017821FE3|nr:hypothetical protein [Sphingomonas sp. CFBP 8760]MBD8548006.1 hypothetical protein [Sphingomonas sp. CFBP 8760]